MTVAAKPQAPPPPAVEEVEEKEFYPSLKTPGFDARFPNQNQVTLCLNKRPRIVGRIMWIIINVLK
jgi:hypothetical protein